MTKHSNRSTDSTRNTRATTFGKSGTNGQSITMLWRVSPMIIIHAIVEILLNDALSLSNSSLKTERRDKLRLRLFLRLSVVF